MATPKTPPKKFMDAMLRNPTRSRIMDVVSRNPGMNKHQVAHALGININSVNFHLKRLVDVGMVQTRPAANSQEVLCFTPDNVSLWCEKSTRILFGRGPARQVAVYLAENPGTSVNDMAEDLGMAQTTVRRHLGILQSYELVQRIRIDRNVIYHAEPQLVDWVQKVEEGLRGE